MNQDGENENNLNAARPQYLKSKGQNNSRTRSRKKKPNSNASAGNNNQTMMNNSGNSSNPSRHSALSRQDSDSYHSNGSCASPAGRSGRRSSSPRGKYSRQESDYSISSASSCCSSVYSSDASNCSNSLSPQSNSKFLHNYKKPVMPPKSQYVAIDCEMVGTLTGKSACARVVLVDWKGRSVLDQHVKPTETITDFRTFVSGITPEDVEQAPSLEEVRPLVHAALAGKILVGHGLSNDLECMGVEHPWHMVRDTALYEPFMKLYHGQLNPRKLKELAQERLNREIQVPGKPHSPIEDAIAALDLYKSHRPRWESCMSSQIKEGQRLLVEQQKQREQYEQYFAGLPVISFPS